MGLHNSTTEEQPLNQIIQEILDSIDRFTSTFIALVKKQNENFLEHDGELSPRNIQEA